MPRRSTLGRFAVMANAREKAEKKVRLDDAVCSSASSTTTSTSAIEDELEEHASLQISSSRRKIDAASAKIPAADGMEQQYTIVSVHQLTMLLCEVLCSECLEPGLDVSIVERNSDGDKENKGFANKLKLRCSGCGYEKMDMSSPRENYAEQKNKPFDVNTRMALFSHEIGASHASLQKFGAVMGMPAPVLQSFQAADKRVTEAEVVAGEEALYQSANDIRKAYAEVDADLQEAMNRGETRTIDISVSFDGTWQKRGFTSLYGVGVAIDVLTGLVVDFHVLSKYCHACRIQEAKNLPAQEMEAWRATHAPKCCRNHHASSKAMEQEAAKVLWGRSVRLHNFRYTEMLCDGDSSAFKAVVELDPYPGVQVEKLDCVNHAHKRMGTALRKLAKDERLGGKGVGRLTEGKCDSLQNYYRGAIVNNLDNIDRMRSSVWSTLFHSMSTDERPYHYRCPTSPDTWCFYQKALIAGTEPRSHNDIPSHTFLAPGVAEKMVPVFRRMSDEALLKRMQHGGTQNTNESLNNLVWLRCPKAVFMGKGRVDGATARAVAVFNEGAFEITRVMNKLYVDLTLSTLESLGNRDQHRIRKADAAVTARARHQRRDYARQRRLAVRAEHAQEGQVYGPGMA
ncbi:uncharacterized protein [Littorina saxatilis]|uniref:uncharacterized protein n=1 Tax=Littorina saxatilis TaxID=31220 RepID=UPI0038B52244